MVSSEAARPLLPPLVTPLIIARLLILHLLENARKVKTAVGDRLPIMEKVYTDMFVVLFRSLTTMLVVVSSYSVLSTFPSLLVKVMSYLNVYISMQAAYVYIWAVKVIAPWNYCGNFFFYVLFGKQFRQEITLMFCCRKRSSGIYRVFQ